MDETAEKFSVIKTLQSIEDANVVILVLDAQQEISEQDAHIAGFILEAGRALVVAVNKWDGLGEARRDQIKREFDAQARIPRLCPGALSCPHRRAEGSPNLSNR